MSDSLNRRQFLQGAVGGGVALLAAGAGTGLSACAQVQGAQPHQASGFRIAHLTDLHIQPELGADQGVTKALKAVHALDPLPDFIQLGGDMVMDALGEDDARCRMQFDLFKRVLADNTDIPLRYCLGNHDVFGWEEKHGITSGTPAYGKAMAAELLDFETTHYAFDHKGWRFYVLDNIQKDAPDSPITSYQGYVDPGQWEWLEADLSAKDPAVPALVTCHIPIITVTAFNSWGNRFEDKIYRIPTAAVCQDAAKLADLFGKHNVRLNLSGHIHHLDRVEFRNSTYICDGAVSGNWWKGPLEGVEEGFGVIDLHPDGTFEHQYVDYGWDART